MLKKFFQLMQCRKNTGAIIILVAGVLLFFVIFFLVVGIDFAYVYYVRGEVQAAADSAALAGAAKLTEEKDNSAAAYKQEAARQEAWKFACKNRAAQAPVYLATNVSTNCDAPPTYSALNGTANSSTGDIIVGKWRSDAPGSTTCVTGWETLASGYFCRANGSTNLSINAVRVVARRTKDSPGGEVGLIFQKIVQGLVSMGIKREAIARKGMQIAPMPICIQNCGTNTPLTGSPPGTNYYIDKTGGPPYFGWSSFLNNSTSKSDVEAYILGTDDVPLVCGLCIYTTNGLVTPLYDDVEQMINDFGQDYIVNGYTVHGWKVLMPMLTSSAGSCGFCDASADPTLQPTPYQVEDFAEVIITASVHSGSDKHIVVVGTGPGPSGFSSIQCQPCSDPGVVALFTSRLVK